MYNLICCYGGIAQLARACGSYPQCHRFKSSYRYQYIISEVAESSDEGLFAFFVYVLHHDISEKHCIICLYGAKYDGSHLKF